MSVEEIIEALREYLYEQLNDSPETEEKKVRNLNKRKTKSTKEPLDIPAKLKKLHCNNCGAPNWSGQDECPARGKNVRNAKRLVTTQNAVEQTKELST